MSRSVPGDHRVASQEIAIDRHYSSLSHAVTELPGIQSCFHFTISTEMHMFGISSAGGNGEEGEAQGDDVQWLYYMMRS